MLDHCIYVLFGYEQLLLCIRFWGVNIMTDSSDECQVKLYCCFLFFLLIVGMLMG